LGLGLGGNSLYHLNRRRRRQDCVQPETSCLIKAPELRFRALPTAGTDEHIDVVGGGAAALVRLVDARWVDALEDQKLGLGAHRATASLENCRGPAVCPSVDDMLQEGDVAASGHCLEEVAPDDLAAIGQA